jgi:hypothetical protein
VSSDRLSVWIVRVDTSSTIGHLKATSEASEIGWLQGTASS